MPVYYQLGDIQCHVPIHRTRGVVYDFNAGGYQAGWLFFVHAAFFFGSVTSQMQTFFYERIVGGRSNPVLLDRFAVAVLVHASC